MSFPEFFIAKLFLYFDSSSAMQFGVWWIVNIMECSKITPVFGYLLSHCIPHLLWITLHIAWLLQKTIFLLILFVAANPIAEGKKSPFIHAYTVSFIIFLFHMSLGRHISYILIMWLSSKTTSLFLRWKEWGGKKGGGKTCI